MSLKMRGLALLIGLLCCSAPAFAQATGGCCLPDGTCESLTEQECDDRGGVWNEGVDCGDACPGACCLPGGGGCDFVGQLTCELTLGGFFQGNSIACDDADCRPFGACCLPTGDCVIEFEDECLMAGGIYEGDGTTDCTDCQPRGACCTPDGVCELDLTQTACELLGGIFQGGGTTDCPDCEPFGACCLPDGTCQLETPVSECAAAGGLYQGDGTTDCPGCEPFGACCLPDGTCDADAFVSECAAQGGQYQGDGSLCADADCEAFGACCLPDGTCSADTPVSECAAQGGQYQGDGVLCADVTCEAFGACCLPDGTCSADTPVSECDAAGGQYQGDGVLCAAVDCEAFGACCLPDGTCELETTISECSSLGGIYQGDGTTDCPDCEPFGACCFLNGDCVYPVPQAECDAEPGAVFQGVGVLDCVDCFPRGACCLPDGSCEDFQLPDECVLAGGTYQGDGSLCADANCLPVVITDARTTASEKGSAFIIPDVRVVWSDASSPPPGDVEAGGPQSSQTMVVADTSIQLTNDDNEPVDVQMYFVNGDDPMSGPAPQPGWNWVDVRITLTANQPTYWSAATGQPATGGVSPWSVLDPANGVDPLPGRPVSPGSSDYTIRGFIVGWAVDADNREISHNHLAAKATTVDYANSVALEHNAYTFQAVSTPNGDGVLMLDGAEYAAGYALVLAPFQAIDSTAYSRTDGAGNVTLMVQSASELTLLPIEMDLRQETDGPVVTKAHMDIWNENEIKFSGAHRCVECWDSFAMDDTEAAHAHRELLQTDFGKIRIDGLASDLCEPSASENPSQAASLLGIRSQFLMFDSGAFGASAMNLYGMGTEAGAIQYDVGTDPIPTGPAGSSIDAALDGYRKLFREAMGTSRP